MNKLFLRVVAFNLSIGVLVLAGCVTETSQSSPVHTSQTGQPLQPVYYTVQMGDSLSAVAAQYHMSYLTLARENNLSPPYSIRVGQKLLIGVAAANSNPPAVSAPAANTNTADSSVHPLLGPSKLQGQALNLSQYGATTGKVYVQGKSLPLPPPTAAELPARTLANQLVQQANEAPGTPHVSKGPQAAAPMSASISTTQVAKKTLMSDSTLSPVAETSTTSTRMKDGISWSWPVAGVVVSNFAENESLAAKGVVLKVAPKSTVFAAAEGSVLYSGTGAKGYGNMIIIKHKNNFLTAYANLSKLLVKQGQELKAHAAIALSGTIDGASRLHFEVRRFGSPVDPLKYMPSVGDNKTNKVKAE